MSITGWSIRPRAPESRRLRIGPKLALRITLPVGHHTDGGRQLFAQADSVARHRKVDYDHIPDMAWCGGISETRKICHLAETHLLPITSHDCTGPVALWSGVHLMLHIPNAMIVETVRAYYDGWYNEVMTERISIQEGTITVLGKPGLGTALREQVLHRPDAHMEFSDERHRIDMSKG